MEIGACCVPPAVCVWPHRIASDIILRPDVIVIMCLFVSTLVNIALRYLIIFALLTHEVM